MPIPGQPPASVELRLALRLLAENRTAEADGVVTAAARAAKGNSGSGSHPLAAAYADMARLHYAAGDFKRAAGEFKHACDNPLPADPAGRRDRLAFMSGYAACLDALGKPADAEKVFRQCVTFARSLHGPAAPGYAAALEPLAALLLRAGTTAEAARLLDEAYDIFWKHGDPAIATVVPARAEALKAVGRPDDPFADLTHLPDDLAAGAVAHTIRRAAGGDGVRVRQVFADLLAFVDRRFGDAHPATAQTLSAITRHETTLGDRGDPAVRAAATRRAVLSSLTRRGLAGLVSRVEVAVEDGGTIHLVPHLTREPSPAEAAQLEDALARALDELYARGDSP